jgi:hypothetical protein
VSAGFFSAEKERFMFLFERKDSNSFTRRRGGAKSGVEFAKYARYLCVLFLFAGFLVLGCEEADDKNPSLNGTWVSEYGEKWIIDLDKKTLDCPSEDYPEYAYAGTIRDVGYFNSKNTAGIIFIELTNKGSSWITSGSGNFTGIYFVNLTDNTVEISAASDSSYATPVRATLAEAKQLLNVDSVSTYFAATSVCERK